MADGTATEYRLGSFPIASTRPIAPFLVHHTMAEPNGTGDWQDRYYHIDQILDKPGPRTDPQFTPGNDVRNIHKVSTALLLSIKWIGQILFT